MERVGLGCRTAATHLRTSLMNILAVPYMRRDSQVRRTPLRQSCTITARKARSFPAADGGGRTRSRLRSLIVSVLEMSLPDPPAASRGPHLRA
eukprot:6207708-Pleurochrysis_carterae.AAC.1